MCNEGHLAKMTASMEERLERMKLEMEGWEYFLVFIGYPREYKLGELFPKLLGRTYILGQGFWRRHHRVLV